MNNPWSLALPLTLLLAVCACSQRPVLLGSQPGPAGAAVASPNVQSWWLIDQVALPRPGAEAMNQRLATLLQESLPITCMAGQASLDRGQRALFDHVAGLLRRSPGMPLEGLGIGHVQGLPAGCRQLWMLTGRLGGGAPGWLALAVIDLPAGSIGGMAIGRWAASGSVTDEQVAELASQLRDRLGNSRL